jgi:signal transduction histidine kinase/ligand-binding sensor domain-containing protein
VITPSCRPAPFLAGLFGLALPLSGQTPARPLPPLDEYHIRAFGPANGLPAANIRGLARGDDGYLYVATGRGLTRFDGQQFHIVPLPQARSTAIELMKADSSGRLWLFGPDADLMGFVQHGRFRSLPPSVAYVWRLSVDDHGAWFGGLNGLVRFDWSDLDRPMTFTRSDGLPSDTVLAPITLGNERLVLTRKGLVRVEVDPTARGGYRFVSLDSRFTFVGPVRADEHGLWAVMGPTSGVFPVLRYRDGRVFPYDSKDGAPYLPLETFDWRDRPGNSSSLAGSWPVRLGGGATHLVGDAIRARDGTLWIALVEDDAQHELIRSLAGRVDTVPLRAHAAFQTLNHLLEDHEGSIWVGTDQGLFQLAPRQVATLGVEHGLKTPFTVPILQTRDGSLWIGTWGGGLHRFHNGRLADWFGASNGLPSDEVRALYEAADGTLWVGLARGFAAIRDRRIVLSRASDHVRAFAETRDGAAHTLWLGTETGLFARHGDDIVPTPYSQIRSIWALHTARDGALWIGTEHGLFRLAGDSLHEFGPEDGLRSAFTASISEEPNGTLWFGTYEHGLHRYRGRRFVPVTTAEGLLHNGVWRMILDDRGGVWMSSDGGVFRVEHRRLQDVADAIERGERPRQRLSPIIFRETEGMPSRESNRGSPAGWRLQDGRLVFNNIAGAVVIDPVRAIEQRTPSPTVLLAVTADGRLVATDSGSPPRLDAGTKQIAFEFATLSFITPYQTRYRYRLDGYDDDWVQGGMDRQARYTNLPPRNYTFRVQGASAAGAWSESAAVSFALAPFVWETSWFGLASAAAFLAIIIVAHRMRVRRLMEIERLRLRIAADLHDDVGSNLSSIALLSDMLQRDTRLVGLEQRQLQRIHSAAEETVGALRDIIWLVGPNNGDLQELVRRMRTIAADVLNGTPHRFEAESIDARRAGTRFMRDVLLIYKEALHNIHKHARATDIEISVRANAGEFTLRIEDDGVGFDEARIGAGHGVANMRRRARECGGALEIARIEAGGTRVEFRAPLANAARAGSDL